MKVPAFILILIALLGAVPAQAEKSAFPGAQGYGRFATGWRGGQIVYVTNLNDKGEGSLRACVEDVEGPHICVFETSGTISVDSPIVVRSYTYIAGQSAPGDGIQLKLGKGQSSPIIVKGAKSVVIRYLKIRPGESSEPSTTVDAVTIEDSQDVYLDHLSMQFATDENLGIFHNEGAIRDVTIANSILAWGLDRTNHGGHHSKGALICSSRLKDGMECGRISILRNLFANNRDRNPDVKGSDTGPIEVVNNVVYNPLSQFGEFYNQLGNTRVDYIGNVALAGPSTRSEPHPTAVQAFARIPDYHIEVYVEDNINALRKDCGDWTEIPVVDDASMPFITKTPAKLSVKEILPAEQVYETILSTAGASRAGTEHADSLDARLLDETKNCGGHIIDSVEGAGGWPEIAVEKGPVDTDRDGMPDAWEEERGLDPNSAADIWSDPDEDGWANIEEYLNIRAAKR